MLTRSIYQEEHEIFRNAVRKFCESEITPHAEEWERQGVMPREFWLKAGQQGLLGAQVPEEYGGPGGDFYFNAIIDEEFAYTGASALVGCSVHSDICCGYILRFGTEEQKRTWLPRLVSGEVISAIAMTEPGTGSDLQSIRTTATRDGDDYVINGAKTFISNGQTADLVIVVAKTDPGQGSKGTTLFLVESHREGFSRGRNLKKIGLKGQDTSELFYDNVRVPAANRLGAEGMGFVQLMQELPQERMGLSVGAAAAAQKAYDITLEYVRERRAFGKPIADFQNTRFKLAELKTQLAVGWAYIDQCLAKHVRGELTVDEAAMAKLWLTELQGRVVDECVQLHGGYGYMSEYLIARMYVDARVQRIYGGTSEIMKEIISRNL
ncbi:MAG: acyl-CoA dehydrogenase family protein [Sphingomonadales bacterium]